jgi:BCD family chlorophyll transporter-like MFS transporter
MTTFTHDAPETPQQPWWVRLLPFADVASKDLPLSRLMRLALFQMSVGMALVLLIGTLNRVMIVELKVSASLVAVMVAMPLIFAPFRALIGYRSDKHVSAIGWRRVPYIWMGSMIQFGGLAVMPFALLVLAGAGQSASAPAWVGQLAAGLAFLLVGAGLHTTQTVGLALATDLAPVEDQPKVVGLMYVMLLAGMVFSALLFGYLLRDFSPGALIEVIQGAAVVTLLLNGIAVWKQETIGAPRATAVQADQDFAQAWSRFTQGDNAKRRLIAVGLGTMAFSMEDVLLEPFGGEILHLTVGVTTALTATLALGGLAGFAWASRVLSQGFDPFRMAMWGTFVGIPAFLLVIGSALTGATWMFMFGTLLIGFGAGIFGHGTLTATMNLAPKDQAGLALGAWGAVQATAAGVAVAWGGIMRDLVAHVTNSATGYLSVYVLEAVLLLITMVAMVPLLRSRSPSNPAIFQGESS